MDTIKGILLLAGVVLTTTSARAQCQAQKLVASDMQQGDQFGYSISVSGDWLIVGAPLDDDLGLQAGAAYLFQRQGSAWVEVQKIHASDGAGSAQFGYSVAISGDAAVVGAFTDSPQGIFAAGSAYVFELVGSTWTETAKLVANDASPNADFADHVAISGDRILVGDWRDNAVSPFSGSAYVFEKVGGSWTQIVKLIPNDAAQGDAFGFAVALEGDRAVIGAPDDDGPSGQNNTGSAYVFEHTPTGWVQVQELIPNDPMPNQFFGISASISGSTVLVGADADTSGGTNAGAAHVFENQAGTWTQVQKLTAIDQSPQNLFGGWVTLVADTALIGTLGDGDNGFGAGSAYVFRRNGSTWAQVGKMLAADGSQGDLFGSGVALVGNTAIVGAFSDDDACPTNIACDSGSVYVFKLAPTAVQYGSCPTGSPCNNPDDHGGCRNSTGQGAMLAACGSGSVTTDDLQLEVTRCPPNKLTLLFMGPGQSTTIYGDGIRVASALNGVGVYRFGGAYSDSLGRGIRGPGIVAQSQGFPQTAGHIQPGSTWNFQIWYRDPPGPCGGHTNFSNGVQVAFGP